MHPMAATKHGAHSPALLEPVREQHLERLLTRFPQADVTILGLQATRAAQLQLVGAWLDGKGIIRNKRFGTIWPAAEYWGKVALAYERANERLEQQQREAAPNPAESLAEIEQDIVRRRQLTAGTDPDDGQEGDDDE